MYGSTRLCLSCVSFLITVDINHNTVYSCTLLHWFTSGRTIYGRHARSRSTIRSISRSRSIKAALSAPAAPTGSGTAFRSVRCVRSLKLSRAWSLQANSISNGQRQRAHTPIRPPNSPETSSSQNISTCRGSDAQGTGQFPCPDDRHLPRAQHPASVAAPSVAQAEDQGIHAHCPGRVSNSAATSTEPPERFRASEACDSSNPTDAEEGGQLGRAAAGAAAVVVVGI